MKASQLPGILAQGTALCAANTRFRVRYGETDKMGVAYYGSYLDWFESGRTELIRSLGLSYRKMEEAGLFLPVREVFCRYKAPLAYDDAFGLETEIVLVERFKVAFRNRIIRDGALRAEGGTLHVSTDEQGRISPVPEDIRKILTAQA